jgi:hypothetical protein
MFLASISTNYSSVNPFFCKRTLTYIVYGYKCKMSLPLLPPQKFSSIHHVYYGSYNITNYDVRIFSDGTTFPRVYVNYQTFSKTEMVYKKNLEMIAYGNCFALGNRRKWYLKRLMFVPCIIRRSRNDQNYELNCATFIQCTGSYMFRQ